MSTMMDQYINIKEKHKDCIVFFRLGDFYEMFYDDAILCSKELELNLTSRKKRGEKESGKSKEDSKDDVPMCGVPHHSCDAYIQKLIKKGYKVVMCEQMESHLGDKEGLTNNKNSKIIDRQVVRVITPGTVIENGILEDYQNNYIVSVYKNDSKIYLCSCDVSTGELNFTITDQINLMNEISRFNPTEVLIDRIFEKDRDFLFFCESKFNSLLTFKNFSDMSLDDYKTLLKTYFIDDEDYKSLIKDRDSCVCLGALFSYLSETQITGIQRINQFRFYKKDDYMVLPYSTKVNLEILQTLRNKDRKGSLIWVLDNTNTPMGKRLLRNFLEKPLMEVDEINKRLDSTQEIFDNFILRDELIDSLKNIKDIERFLTRIVYGNSLPREIISLKLSISYLSNIKNIINNFKSPLLKSIYEGFDDLSDIFNLIEKSICDEPPAITKDGGYIKDGFDDEIDSLRYIISNGKDMLADMVSKIKEETGIKGTGIKISYNKIFGYFFEVSSSQQHLIPDNFIRRQTMANCERYVTDDLKVLENKILNAKENVLKIERSVYSQIMSSIASDADRIQNVSNKIALLDVLVSFAVVSFKNNYIRPNIVNDGSIKIKDGRHPVIEKMTNNIFVPNNSNLDNDKNMINIITGPNMAGKSTYMRQIAIITIMAQIGCFVPASSADISLVDKLFTRVGASDDLTSGMSTFMIEMTEVAEILNFATSKSLLILDEIGRGTSTYDGMSIAKSVIEYIGMFIKAKTLFATHYHELSNMDKTFDYIKNYSISVKRKQDNIVFLRKIVKGGADQSYGIDVANLAGVPYDVIKRAKEILFELEGVGIQDYFLNDFKNIDSSQHKYEVNDFISNEEKEILDEIRHLDVDVLTPIEAMMKLSDISKRLKIKELTNG